MKKKRKYKKMLNEFELVLAIFNKQLEPFKVTFEDIKDIEDWYQQFEVSEKENQEWIEWGINFIVENAINPLLRSKKRARSEMKTLNFSHGLKIKDYRYKKILLTEKTKP